MGTSHSSREYNHTTKISKRTTQESFPTRYVIQRQKNKANNVIFSQDHFSSETKNPPNKIQQPIVRNIPMIDILQRQIEEKVKTNSDAINMQTQNIQNYCYIVLDPTILNKQH